MSRQVMVGLQAYLRRKPLLLYEYGSPGLDHFLPLLLILWARWAVPVRARSRLRYTQRPIVLKPRLELGSLVSSELCVPGVENVMLASVFHWESPTGDS